MSDVVDALEAPPVMTQHAHEARAHPLGELGGVFRRALAKGAELEVRILDLGWMIR